MGTLFDQPPRKHFRISDDELEGWVSIALKLASEYEIGVADVIAAKAALEAERRNDLYAHNGDIFDEQIAGIGDLLQDLTRVIENGLRSIIETGVSGYTKEL